MTFTIPIYYTQQYKTKDDKTFLINLNWFRNAFFHQQNAVKIYIEDIVSRQLEDVGPILGPYTVHYKLYYKNGICDGSNIIPMAEKFFLDALQIKHTREDNVKHHFGSSWEVVEQDRENPRVEITIQPKD